MSAQPQEKSKNHRRKPNKAPADVLTGDESAQTDENPSRPRAKPRNKNNAQQHESALTQGLQDAGAATPPRAQPQSINNPNNESDHVVREGQKSGRKKRNNNNHNQQNGGQEATTPGPKQRRPQNSKTTPSKPPVAMDAYAGPTFHASPAPSALPIPKMFSRSAPAADKEVGIVARLHQEEGNVSSGSDGVPDSPTERPSTTHLTSQGSSSGGPALFDMLLNADRQEKARQFTQSLSPQQTNAKSASPVHQRSQHRPRHSRTLTDSQMFPAEEHAPHIYSTQNHHMGQQQQQQQQFGSPFNNNNTSYGQPSPNDGNLKRMLFSSPTHSGPAPNGYYGPSAGPAQWNSSPASQGTASPYDSPQSSNSLASSSRPAPGSPYTQASPSPSARRGYYPPHSNSGLRREVSPGNSNMTPPHLSGLPRYHPGNTNGSPLASPTQQRFNDRNSPFGNRGQHSPNRVATPPDNRRFSAQDAIKSLGNGSKMTEMEDRLRQILKIDELRPQATTNQASANPVPS